MFTRRRFTLGIPALALASTGIARAQNIVSAPFTLTDQRILMDVRINGRGPYSFVIDSGASVSVILPEKARELGLKPSKTMKTDNGRTLPTDVAEDFVIGGTIEQKNVSLSELSTNLGADGILASGMLTSVDCELDFDQSQWRLHPDGSRPTSDFQPIPVEFKAAAPTVFPQIYAPVTVNGQIIQAVLDTGAPRMLDVSYEIGQRLGLLDPGVSYAPIAGGSGVDLNHYVSRLVRAKTLQLGPFDYQSILVVVRPKGAYGQPALLGLPILRTLNMWFEGPQGRLSAKRSAKPMQGGGQYRFSGVWLDGADARVTVADVGTGSPAALAGVQVGDILDGLDLASANKLMNSPPNTPVALNLQRGGKPVKVAFTTARYL